MNELQDPVLRGAGIAAARLRAKKTHDDLDRRLQTVAAHALVGNEAFLPPGGKAALMLLSLGAMREDLRVMRSSNTFLLNRKPIDDLADACASLEEEILSLLLR